MSEERTSVIALPWATMGCCGTAHASFNNGSQCVHNVTRGIFSPCFYSNLPDVDVNVGTRLLYDLIVKFALWKLVVLNNQVKKTKT